MSSTHRTVLNQILDQERQQFDASMSEAEFFEFFSAQQIFRPYSLSPDDISSGIVGQESNDGLEGTDGGIDSMFLFVNGELIRDIDQARDLKRRQANIEFNIVFITSTIEHGFALPKMLRILGRTSKRDSPHPRGNVRMGEDGSRH